jgi:subtilisin family serine protease
MKGLVLLIALLMLSPMAMMALGDEPSDTGEGAPSPEGAYLYLRGATFDPLFEEPDVPEGLLTDADEFGIGLFIVQLEGPVQKEWPKDLVSNGARILGYLPSYSYLIEMDNWERDAIEGLDFVRAICPMHTAFKLEPALWQGAEGLVEVTISVHRDMEVVLGKVLSHDSTVVSAVDDVIWAHVPVSALVDIAEMEAVLWIERAPRFQLLNDVAAGIINVNITKDTHGLNGTGQIVAVCDSGLDTGVNDATMHDDFEGRINALIDLWPGAGDGANDTHSGHGTHVAGSVLGNGTKSSGKIEGMAPEARLYFQATESNAGGFATPVPLDTQVFQPAYTAGARIHTNSWGSSVSDGSYTARSREVDVMIWDNDDMVILFAVGNDGVDSDSDGIVDTDSIDAPSTAKNCIAVGATESYRPDHGWGWDAGDFPVAPISGDKAADDPDGMAAFSSRGPVNDNRVKPDIVTPGTGILSARSSEASGTGWGLPGAAEGDSTYYMFMGGTSMATPIAAGTATLVRQFYVDHESISPSAALIKGTLINGADDIPGQYASPKTDTTPIPDNSQGWGRVNLTNSIFPSPRELIYDDQNHALDTDENYTYELDVTSSLPLKITLVWTDYPALAAANPTLVNDLDLKVTAPNSSVYWGNHFNNGESDTGGSADNRNNVENVYIQSPSAGKYTIEVNASNIALGGPQSYAIIFSGVFSAPPPTAPTLNAPAAGAYTSARPTFNITSDDVNGDDIQYRIELSKDDFTSIYRTINQSEDTTGWSDSIYATGEDALYTIKIGDDLQDGVKYYWRAWAFDGDNWSASSVISNFTVDAASPTGLSISINSGDNSTNSLSATLTLSATDNDSGMSGGQSGMSFSQDGTSWTGWESYSASKTLSLEDFQGLHRVYFRARDAVGNMADAVSSTIIYDDVDPSGLTISIDMGAEYSNDTTVDLTVSASDTTSGLDVMSFSNDGLQWSTWEVFSSSKTGWDLTDVSYGGNANDEVKTVHFKVRDNAGNAAPSVSSSISMDTTDPQGVTLTINGGDDYTNDNLVHLAIDGTDAMSGISMMTLNIDGAGFGPWEPFASSKFVMLPGDTGSKSIEVRLRDKAGNVATEALDNIMLDLESPEGILIIPEADAVGSTEINLTLEATDTGSGLKDMSFSFDGDIWTAWEAWAVEKTLTLPDVDGRTRVYVRVRDMADNIGGPVFTSILLDTEGPAFSVTINGGSDYTSSETVDVEITLLETTGDFDISDYSVSFSNDGLSWSTFTELTDDLTWDLAPGDGEKTVQVILQDPVGNQLELESETIVLDTIAPLNTELIINDGDAYSTSSLIDCDLYATDENGLAYMSFSTDGATWSAMEPWSKTKVLDIGHGNGARTLYVRITDLAGNQMTAQDEIILDEYVPEIYTLRINNASEDSVPYVTDEVVYYELSTYDEGTNISYVSFGFDGITWGDWEDYAEDGHLTVPKIEGAITVYARVMDKAGNIADTVGAQIILDLTPPTSVSIKIDNGAQSTTEAMVDVSISAMDTTSGLDQYRYKEGTGDWSNWHPFATSRSVRLSDGIGEKTISLEVKDKAGNVAPEVSDTIELKEDATTLPKLFVTLTSHEGGEAVKGTVKLTGSVTGGTPSSIEIRIDGESWTSIDNRGTWSYNWNTMKYNDGAHVIEVRASNGAEHFYSGPVILTVKNKAEPANQGTSGIDTTSLLIYIIIGAVVGAAAGGGVAAAMKPKQPPPSLLASERDTYPKKKKRAASSGYAKEDTCAYCGYKIEEGEKPMSCSCGRTYHEDCASEVNGYCEDCGSDLY